MVNQTPQWTAGCASTAATADDASLRLADRVIDAHHLAGQTGLLYRENLATYLFHALGDGGVDRMLDGNVSPTIDNIRANTRKMAAARWITKVERDLKSPYDDHDVFDRLEELDAKFREEVVQLRSWTNAQHIRIKINGSLAKGRMGKNSDIDGQVQTSDPCIHERLLQFFRTRPHDHVSFFPLSPGAEGRVEQAISGPTLDLGDGSAVLKDDHFLTHYYIEVMKSKGYKIEPGRNGRMVVKMTAARPERRREANIVLEKFFELSRPDQEGHRVWRFLKKASFRTAGALLPLPVVGPAVAWALDKLAPTRKGSKTLA